MKNSVFTDSVSRRFPLGQVVMTTNAMRTFRDDEVGTALADHRRVNSLTPQVANLAAQLARFKGG